MRISWTSIGGLKEARIPRRTSSDPAQRPRRPQGTLYDQLKEKLNALSEQIYNNLFQISEITPSKSGRQIELDVQHENFPINDRTKRPYIDNTIRSSRYTFWNFFPRQSIAQFSKLGNFYFLCVSIVQMIPSLSTTGRYTTLIPLLIFVGISMSKEAQDDLRRSRLDKEENNRSASILRVPRVNPPAGVTGPGTAGLWAESKWQNIKVGNVLRIQRDEPVPADIALLSVDGTNGVAYIETMALDGETNLKSKQASQLLTSNCDDMDRLCSIKAHFVVEDPNLDLYKFEGRVSIADEVLPLANDEIIYRGSILRNTRKVYGIVIYTGEECKIRMNATKNPRTKAPTLQKAVNKVVIMLVCFVVALSILNTIAYQIWQDKVEDHAFYLSHAGVGFFQLLASFFLMFNPMIPLSLYISLEIVKLVQVSLMEDIDMYDEESDTPMEPRTSTINEELGQVSHIFSDKTGTLTDNAMRFRGISVAGTAWLHGPDPREEASFQPQMQKLLHREGDKEDKAKEAMVKTTTTIDGCRTSTVSTMKDHRPGLQKINPNQSDREKRRIDCYDGTTKEMLDHVQNKPDTIFARHVRFFLLSIALCHTCLPEKGEDGTINFQAASSDEVALVKAAQALGYLVVDRHSSSIMIRTSPGGPGSDPVFETYEILDVIEFSSARRRMSIIIRMPDQRICLFCKGADTVIQHLLRLSILASEKATDIKQRMSKRRGIETQQAVTRETTARASRSLLRPGIYGRLSMTRGRLTSIRNNIYHWLQDGDNKAEASPTHNNSTHYLPQPSVQLLADRKSFTISKGRSYLQDEQIDERLETVIGVSDNAVFEKCFQHINDFACEGLRTLLYAYRYVDEANYMVWRELYQEAKTSLDNRQSLIEQAGDQLERDLEIIGATAIEDRLQEGVPEAIDKLRRANIRLWMLTGDKLETAISVSRSCRLIKDYSTVMVLDGEVDNAIQKSIADAIVSINDGVVAHCVVVIDGQTLSTVEAQPIVRDIFLDLVILTDSVICCQASPSQKASLVKSIRKRLPPAVTLAIGDGANDIAMIQEAHVGIGITGKEGLQAARISDYSIAQFRFLLKLLLVHGRWNYVRTCKYILGTFWKELLLYFTQAFYQHWNGYTGISLYEPWSLTLFQPLFTCLPVVFIGIFEKDLAASTLLAVPELYSIGQLNGGFNIRLFLWWVFMSASDAVIVFFIMLSLYGNARFAEDDSLYAMGTLTFTACVIIISVKMQVLEMHNKTVTVISAILFSVGSWFVWDLILSATYTDNEIYDVKGGLLGRFGQSALWWLTLILILFTVMIYELAVSSMQTAIWPTEVDVFQEYERNPEIKKRFEGAAAGELRLS